MYHPKKNQAGFTLIELALIIAVLGILGAVGAVKLASMTTEAKNAAAQTALANARSAFAIGIAKEPNGEVTAAELAATYLTGATAPTTSTLKIADKYTVTMTLAATGDIITSIDSVSH